MEGAEIAEEKPPQPFKDRTNLPARAIEAQHAQKKEAPTQRAEDDLLQLDVEPQQISVSEKKTERGGKKAKGDNIDLLDLDFDQLVSDKENRLNDNNKYEILDHCKRLTFN